MAAREMMRIMIPEEMAVIQNSKDVEESELSNEIIRALAELIQLSILKAGYIPYMDHPRSHPSDYATEISIDLVSPIYYLQYLKRIFEPKGWDLLPFSRYKDKKCAVVVRQTVQERRDWIRKMWEGCGHRLAPWDLGYNLDMTHCMNEGCNLKIVFRRQIPSEYRDGTEYRLGEGVWAGNFKDCPATPSYGD